MALLSVVQSADFLFLLSKADDPWKPIRSPNRLEDAGYVEIAKEFIERKPHTALALTERGRDTFKQYRRNVKQIAERFLE